MSDLLLATDRGTPDGEPGHEALDAQLTQRGIASRWVCWDDDSVDWSGALVAVRSTWDYHRRLPDFLTWASSVPRLLNGADVFAWNADKSYLVDAGAHLPTVPTWLVESPTDLEHLPLVLKPRVSASGEGVQVLSHRSQAPASLTGQVAQPLVDSVRTLGETSLMVIGGAAVCQVDKVPATGEIRVHEEYGGRSRAVPIDPARAALAEAAMGWASERAGRELDYGRVDLLFHEGRWCLSELELIEPGLYLDVAPSNAVPFADLVVDRLSAR